MTTLWRHRTLSGFGDPLVPEPERWVSFAILWDGDDASMPGWSQENQKAEHHVPGSNRNIVFLLGLGALTRTFAVSCASRAAFANLAALQQTTGVLRVPAAMNELSVATEIDLYGQVMADIPDVVLLELSEPRVWGDGDVSAQATFWRDGRE